jgi:hypothetical protein
MSLDKKIEVLLPPKKADVAELVDAPDLGSGAARRGGSSPFIRTSKKKAAGKTDNLFFVFKHYRLSAGINFLMALILFCLATHR